MCLSFACAALICFALVAFWAATERRLSALERTISATNDAAMRMFHASVAANGPDRPKGKERKPLRKALSKDRRAFSDAIHDLDAFFAPPLHMGDRLALPIPTDVRAAWDGAGGDGAVTDLLNSQIALCNDLCRATGKPGEGDEAALARFRTLYVDRLTPALTALTGAVRVWKDRTMTATAIVIGLAFLSMTLGLAAVWLRMVRPMSDALEGASRKLIEQNLNLEREVALRTADITAALDEARASVAVKSAFLENLNHEIRTPLNAVIGFSRLLEEMEQDPGRKEMASTIRQSGATLQHLLSTAMQAAESERGDLALTPEATLLSEVLEDCHALFAGRAADKGLTLTHRASGRSGEAVIVDAERLRQAVNVLLDNAIRYTGRGEVTLTLDQQQDAAGEAVEISVTDTGPGIDPDLLEEIFRPFQSIEDGEEGAGLGLTMARGVVEAMDGSLHAMSWPGAGATFTIRLVLPSARSLGEEGVAAA